MIALVLVAVVVLPPTRLGAILAFFLGAPALALAAYGVRRGQLGLLLLSFAAVIRDILVGIDHTATYVIVFLCVVEFALLMGLVADKPPIDKTDRRLNLVARLSAAIASVWWAVDCWPPSVGVGGIAMAAYGLVIACLGGRRSLIVYFGMTAVSAHALADSARLAAEFIELREASGTMPDPYTFEFAVVAAVLATVSTVCALWLEERYDQAKVRAVEATTSKKSAPKLQNRRTVWALAIGWLALAMHPPATYVALVPLFVGSVGLLYIALGVASPVLVLLVVTLSAAVLQSVGAAILVVICVVEFTRLMMLRPRDVIANRLERAFTIGARVCAAICSAWWVVDRWPLETPGLPVSLAALGLVISCCGDRRWLSVWVAVMTAIAAVAALDFSTYASRVSFAAASAGIGLLGVLLLVAAEVVRRRASPPSPDAGAPDG